MLTKTLTEKVSGNVEQLRDVIRAGLKVMDYGEATIVDFDVRMVSTDPLDRSAPVPKLEGFIAQVKPKSHDATPTILESFPER